MGAECAMRLFRIGMVTLGLTVFAAGCTIGQQERKYRVFFNETAQAQVTGFRLPDESEYGPAWAFVEGQGWQTRDGSGETKAEFWTSGEFNGDGTTDYAYILVEEATDVRSLFVFVSTTEGYKVERLDRGFDWGIWLRTRVPGNYAATARGAGPDSLLSVVEFEVKNQAIDFFQSEGSTSSFVWNPATQSFDRFWIRN